MKRIRIILEYLLAFLIVCGLLIAIAGTVIIKFYGDEVQSMVIRGINSKIDTKIYVEQANINLFRKFPSASIVLEDITIWSSHNLNTNEFADVSTDTLLHAETVYLSVNLLDILRKKYSIKQFVAKNGSLRIITDSRGEGNYKFIIKSGDEKQNEGLFVLNELKLQDFECTLINLAKELDVKGDINELKLNGKFYRKDFELKTQSDIYIDKVVNKGIIYASNQTFKSKVNLNVSDSLYQISNGTVQIQTIMAKASGQFILDKSGGFTSDIRAEAKDVDIAALSGLIPLSFNEKMKGFKGDGKIDLFAAIEGKSTSTQSPYINLDFNTRDVSVETDVLPFKIRKLNLTGNFNNGSKHNPITSTINIKDFTTEIEKDLLEGSMQIENLFSPEFNINLSGNITPSQWVNWFEPPAIEMASGELKPNLFINGSYFRSKKDDMPSVEFNINGDVGFNDISFKLKNNNAIFDDISGIVSVRNDMWEPSLSGNYGDSDFRIEGTGLNLISYIFRKQGPLIISANFYSDKIDLHQILQNIGPKSNSEKKGIQFPDDLSIRLNYSISEFEKDRFNAENVRGTISYDSPILFVDSLFMQTMGGNLSGSIGMTQGGNGDIYTNVFSKLYKIDIQKLFYAFNSFGQKQITDENIRGTVSGVSEFSAMFSKQFKINTESIVNENEVQIREGELNNFEPILALSKFIDIEELENIHFATLNNTILIKDSKVIIPKMDIQSSALNLSASGIHNLDKTYEYRIRLLLSELLYNKTLKSDNTDYQVALDASDTRTLFLKIHSDGKEVEVDYDGEKAAEKIREDLKQEKGELKKLLNEELGLFKKEMEKKEEQTESKQEDPPLFKFEFDEEESNEDTIPSDAGSNRDRKLKRNKK